MAEIFRQKIFVIYDHDDADQVNYFVKTCNNIDGFEFYKLDHRIKSNNIKYIKRIIREKYIKPAYLTIVIIGENTANSPWINWEIEESLRQRKEVLGIKLNNNNCIIPSGISHTAVRQWQPDRFVTWIKSFYKV